MQGRRPTLEFNTLFPLTPALSLRERVTSLQSWSTSRRFRLSHALVAVLPLPKGEGRGEGEQIGRINFSFECIKIPQPNRPVT